MTAVLAGGEVHAQQVSRSVSAVEYSVGREALASLTDLGSNFLRRLGRQTTWGFNAALGDNANGAGASESMTSPPFRSWAEGYWLGAQSSPQGDFVGDRRSTIGGVAGLGVSVAPGLNLNLSVDQSRTRIDAPLAFQTGAIDLTQFGMAASYASGPWTIAVAGVYGAGRIGTSRDTGLGFATSGYDGRVSGALGEISYYHAIGQTRFVPKASLEYVRGATTAMQETGGFLPISAGAAFAERARVMLGAEIGRYWIVGQTIFDLSAYGKFVDNVHQATTAVSVQGPFGGAITVQGLRESVYGADAGATASVSMSSAARLYLSYDGKYRASNSSHQGTFGFELKW